MTMTGHTDTMEYPVLSHDNDRTQTETGATFRVLPHDIDRTCTQTNKATF